MKKYLEIIAQTLKGHDYFSPVLEKRQMLRDAIDKKIKRCKGWMWYGLLLSLGTGISAIVMEHFSPGWFNLTAYYFMTFMLISFFGSMIMGGLIDSKPWKFSAKEHRAFHEHDTEFFKHLCTNHTLGQELSQWVVDAKSEQAFNEILVNINTQNNDETVAKILKLLDAYDAHTRLSQNNEKHKALHRDFGVHIAPVQAPHRLAQML